MSLLVSEIFNSEEVKLNEEQCGLWRKKDGYKEEVKSCLSQGRIPKVKEDDGSML